jgi:relaxin
VNISFPLPTFFFNLTEIVPSYTNKDAKPLNMMLEFIPNLPQEPKAMLSERRSLLLERQQEYVPVLKDSNLSFEEFKKNFHNRQDEAEDSSPSELKYLGLDTHSRQKRQSEMLLGQRCCQVGCTRRSIAEFC